MAPVRIKGLKRFREPKTGQWYAYHRASGTRIHADYGSPAFFTELDRAEKAWVAKLPSGGTFGHLVDEYQRAPEFLRLKPRTRSDYQRVFDYIEKLRPMPIAKLDQAFITGLRNKAYARHKRRFANYVVQVLSRVCRVGAGLGLVTGNPAEFVQKIRRATGERSLNRPWTREEREAISAAAPPHLAGPIALARYLGVRLGDMIAMRRTSYRAGIISFVTSKSGTEVTIPAPAPLKTVLDIMRPSRTDHLFVNSRGDPWTASGFSSSFRKLILAQVKAGKVGPAGTYHGFRHSVATDLREAGWTPRQIADVLGQKTEAVVSTYSAKADMRKSNATVIQDVHGAREPSRQTAAKSLTGSGRLDTPEKA